MDGISRRAATAAGGPGAIAARNHDHTSGEILPCVRVQLSSGAGELLAERTVHDLQAARGVHLDFAGPPDPARTGIPLDAAIGVHGVARLTPGRRAGATLMLLDGRTGLPTAAIKPCVLPDPDLAREHPA